MWRNWILPGLVYVWRNVIVGSVRAVWGFVCRKAKEGKDYISQRILEYRLRKDIIKMMKNDSPKMLKAS